MVQDTYRTSELCLPDNRILSPNDIQTRVFRIPHLIGENMGPKTTGLGLFCDWLAYPMKSVFEIQSRLCRSLVLQPCAHDEEHGTEHESGISIAKNGLK
jgi:hypothetical protein